ATKVCGPTHWCPHIRGGCARLDEANIRAAVEGSLKRLGVDCIDLYQTHWPDRSTNYFGKLGFEPDPNETMTPIEETIAALDRLVEEGKIRWYGVSNETPWGLMRHLCAAERFGWPKPVSIQNPYNLLNRTFEIGLAEVAVREQVPLLAYSPLAFGVLTGKYLGGRRPKGARLTLFPHYTRYTNPQAEAATRAYVEIAKNAGLLPAQMSIAYLLTKPFVASVIIGATNEAQLEENLAAAELALSDDVREAIEDVHRRIPNPAP
ncbi:MAG: aldo/keto reductase, partial [Zetaproteobacteria bacterium]